MKSSASSPFVVRNKFRGTLTNKSEAVVMDNSLDRDNPNKVVVNYFITENIELLAGHNTVAIFKLKEVVQEAVIPEEKVLVTAVEEISLNSTNLFTNYFDKKKSAAIISSSTQ